MSLKHPLSSQPPNIHATLSASVTVCARKPCVGRVPHTGALLQYITGGGAGSTLSTFGRWGIARKRGGGSGAGVRGDLAVTSRVAETESEVELALVVGVGRRRAMLLVGESPGVERREVD
jgi:hypothetical protein